MVIYAVRSDSLSSARLPIPARSLSFKQPKTNVTHQIVHTRMGEVSPGTIPAGGNTVCHPTG